MPAVVVRSEHYRNTLRYSTEYPYMSLANPTVGLIHLSQAFHRETG